MLVSVVVVTYNSEKYILETLESIKNQTYKNIELIITDDNSIDKTLEIIEKWVEKNKDRFKNIKILNSNKNTGVCANINRGILEANGVYIKTIAGDDLLKENSIYTYLNFAIKNNKNVIFSDYEAFGENVDLNKYEVDKKSFYLSKNEMYKKIIKKNFIPAPTSFINKNIFKDIGLYDETYKLLEDWPYWIKLLENDIEISFINKKLIKYRIHKESISNKNSRVYNEAYSKDLLEFYYKIRRNRLFKYRRFITILDEDLNMRYIKGVLKDGNSMDNITIKTKIYHLINPFYLYRQYVKRKEG